MKLSARFFNLEEMEDKETCRSNIRWNEGAGLVDLISTDGPVFLPESNGVYDLEEDGQFTMVLTRCYSSSPHSSGAEPSVSPLCTDIGEFTYDHVRIFKGSATSIASGVIGIEGKLFAKFRDEGDIHEDNLIPVGFFSMVDTTNDWDHDNDQPLV